MNEEEKEDAEKIENSKINNENSLELEDENIDIESGSVSDTKYDVFNEFRKKLEYTNLYNNNENVTNNIILNNLKNPKPRKRKQKMKKTKITKISRMIILKLRKKLNIQNYNDFKII